MLPRQLIKFAPGAAALLFLLFSCNPVEKPGEVDPASLPKAMALYARVDDRDATLSAVPDVPVEGVQISIEFSREVDLDKPAGEFTFSGPELTAAYGKDRSIVVFSTSAPLEPFKAYTLEIPAGGHFGVNVVEPVTVKFRTAYDKTDKFPRLDDEELLTLVQQRTFKYFWDYAHPVSGLARERLGSGDTVTSGGSGFGIMTFPIAVERGFVSREEAADRLRTIVGFLQHKAARFHGAFPHWLNGTTGAVIPFSANDNGGDLVETAFLIQGLLTVEMYFDRPEEADIREAIEAIWQGVEWDWYTRGFWNNELYWHWSPDREWAMNMKITGWNEAMIVYFLAAASPTHPVSAEAYRSGWARNGVIRNGRSFYGVKLPLGSDYGGPMFFAHYSFLGLDPHIKDQYASYWEQNCAHARINQLYCSDNPGKHAGYSGVCWGLTASDIPGGYAASSPTNDKGVIAPTAALASMPYLPDWSMAALRTFYYVYGDRLWGEYGFYDAFCLDSGWFASSYIAIDQGPIAIMIENYRTGLLWKCFMKHPIVEEALAVLGIWYE